MRRPAHEPDPVEVPPRRPDIAVVPGSLPVTGGAPSLVEHLRMAETAPPIAVGPGNGVGPGSGVGSGGAAGVGCVVGPGEAVRPGGAATPGGEARLDWPARADAQAGPGHPAGVGPVSGAVDTTGAGAELQRLATDLVRRMVEVLAGRRAPAHLSGVALPAVVRYLTATRDTGRDVRNVTGPRRVHVSRTTPDAAEVVAVCGFGPRSRSLTVRLDRTDRTWHASAVRLL